jgi:hypothetical protein
MFSKKGKHNKDEEKPLMSYHGALFGIGFGMIILVSLLSGFMEISTESSIAIAAFLFIFGIAVGAMNVTSQESISFMIASFIILALTQYFLISIRNIFLITNTTLILILNAFANYLTVFIIPAAFIVAFKTILGTAKNE